MTSCPFHPRVQPYLDGDLPEVEARAFRDHLGGCADCAAELAGYARVFALLEATPLAEPAPDLHERVLARVLPSRQRRRARLRAFGWGYAGAVAACVAWAGWWTVQPTGQAVLSFLSAEASRRLLEVTKFVVHSTAFGLLHLASGWHTLGIALERVAPLGRALGAVLSQSAVLGTIGAAAAACAVMLWWLRPREARATREIRHVGVLGF